MYITGPVNCGYVYCLTPPFPSSLLPSPSLHQAQLQHLVLEALLHHLAKHAMNALISTAIIQVLGRLVPMAAGSIAGPYLLDFLRTLVSHLKTTVSRAQSSSEVGWWKRQEGRESVQ